jgi:hypothetical protein
MENKLRIPRKWKKEIKKNNPLIKIIDKEYLKCFLLAKNKNINYGTK